MRWARGRRSARGKRDEALAGRGRSASVRVSNLAKRVATAAVLIPLVVAGVIWLPGPLWTIGVGLVAGLAAREIASLALHAGIDVSPNVVAVETWALSSVAAELLVRPELPWSGDALLGAFILLVVAAFVSQLVRSPEQQET